MNQATQSPADKAVQTGIALAMSEGNPPASHPSRPAQGPRGCTEERIVDEIRKRREKGVQKYGTSVERTDLSSSEWLQHAKEEALDFAIYLERIIAESKKVESACKTASEATKRTSSYQALASRTLPPIGHNHFFPFDEVADAADLKTYQRNVDLLHAAMGISGEAAELTEHIKKAMFYDQKIDPDHLKKEAGDILWYIAAPLCRALGCSFVELMALNVAKLKKRYPAQYSDAAAIARKDTHAA